MILRIDPALPCGALGDDGHTRCGKPATVGMADPAGDGEYTLLPLCPSCIAAVVKLYDVAATATESEGTR